MSYSFQLLVCIIGGSPIIPRAGRLCNVNILCCNPMKFLWKSYEIPIKFLWTSFENPMKMGWFGGYSPCMDPPNVTSARCDPCWIPRPPSLWRPTWNGWKPCGFSDVFSGETCYPLATWCNITMEKCHRTCVSFSINQVLALGDVPVCCVSRAMFSLQEGRWNGHTPISIGW